MNNNNILKITFDAATLKGNIVKDIIYQPSMSNPQLYSAFPSLLFIPSIKLKQNLFDKDLGEDDIKKIFLSPTQFNNFILRLREKKMYEPIKITEAKTKGIIYNNIKFILDLFFKKGDKLFINTKQFIINNYNWDNKYNLIPVLGQNAPIVELNMNFMLHLGDELSFIDSTKLNCIQKKQNIINEYYTLVGLKKPLNKTAPQNDIPVDTTTKIPEKKKKFTISSSTQTGGKKTRNRKREKRKKCKSYKKLQKNRK